MDAELVDAFRHRKIVLFVAILVMMVISIYQYSWSLFAYAIEKELGWDLASVGLTFTIYAYAATFIQPFSGLIADSFGPRKIALLASILVSSGFFLSSYAYTPLVLYLFYGLGGLGVGMLYGVSTATAIKWFPDRRGLATGSVVFGFGAGTALFNWFIQQSLFTIGFNDTIRYLGIMMLLITLPSSLVYKYPPSKWASGLGLGKRSIKEEAVNYKPLEVLKFVY